MSQYDLNGLYDFLTNTPEKGLRANLVDGKVFTESHFQLLLKTVRAGNLEAFSNYFEKTDFPKIKFSANETKVKETFWKDLTTALTSRGLISVVDSKKVA